LAGVSPSVVSYVLNGGPRQVSPERRKRVLHAVEYLDYRPNAIASSLRRGSSRAIGMITPSPENPYFAELADAFERRLAGEGYQLRFAITREDASRDREIILSMLDQMVDGLMLLSAGTFHSIPKTAQSRVPVVVVDHIPRSAHASSVRIANGKSCMEAVGHLQSLGHRRIACIVGPLNIQTSRERLEGWRIQQKAIGGPSTDDFVGSGAYTAEGGAIAMKEILMRLPHAQWPTAVFVSSDAQAQGVLAVCHDRGLNVPEAISIVCVDGSSWTRYNRPSVTAVRQPMEEIVEVASGLLIAHITDPTTPFQHIVLDALIVERESCAPLSPIVRRSGAAAIS